MAEAADETRMESKPVNLTPAAEAPAAPQTIEPSKSEAPAVSKIAESPKLDVAANVVATQDDQADLRLVIEEGPGGSYVYKTIDRRTGDVVRQFPREEILQMRDAEAYAAGAVVDAKA